jgi:DnaJ family protein C protein 17
MKNRDEWARQASERRKERMNALDEARKAREASWKAQQEQEDYTYQDIIDRMLEDLCRLNPEWQVRKEEAQRVSLG